MAVEALNHGTEGLEHGAEVLEHGTDLAEHGSEALGHAASHGIDLWQLILDSNLINFTLIVAFLAYITIKLLPKSAENTKEKIQTEIKEAIAAREAAEHKLRDLESKLSNSEQEMSKIVSEAENTADEIKSKIGDEASEQIERLKALSEKDIASKKNDAINSIKEVATRVSLSLTEETIRQASKDPEVLKNLQDKFNKELQELK